MEISISVKNKEWLRDKENIRFSTYKFYLI